MNLKERTKEEKMLDGAVYEVEFTCHMADVAGPLE
jgi:hypothetical protein